MNLQSWSISFRAASSGKCCDGCRPVQGHCIVLPSTCDTYACITARGLDFCYECSEYPCAKLNPAADRAQVLPHNTKVFNLCCIEKHGVDKFLEKQGDIRQRYFRGKMVVGKGPQLE